MTKEQAARLVLQAHAQGMRLGAKIATGKGDGFSEEQHLLHVSISAKSQEQQAEEPLYESAQTIITRYTRRES